MALGADGFEADGFAGDGFGPDVTSTLPDKLAFIRMGIMPNLLVEVELQPNLVTDINQLAELMSFDSEEDKQAFLANAANVWSSDGFANQTDGFADSSFVINTTVPRRFYFSTQPTVFPSDDPQMANKAARALIRRNIRIRRTIDSAISGSSAQLVIGSIELSDDDYYISTLASLYRVDGRRIRIFIGPKGGYFSQYVQIATVYGDSWQTDQSVGRTRIAVLKLSDLGSALQSPIQTEVFNGQGGYHGDSALAGRLRPYLVGRRRGVEGVLIDRGNLIYQVSNTACTFMAGYFGGEQATLYADYDTYEELVAARSDIPEGQWASCAALGLYTPRPTGDGSVPYVFTVDVVGDGGGELISTSLIRILKTRTNLSASQIDTVSLTAFGPYSGGYYAGGGSEVTVKTVLEALTRSVFGRLTVGEKVGAVLMRDPSTDNYDYTLSELSVAKSLRRKAKEAAWRAFNVAYLPIDRVLNANEIVLPSVEADIKDILQRPVSLLTAVYGKYTGLEHRTALETYVHRSVVNSATDAADILERLRVYGERERYIWEVEMRLDEVDLPLGSIVRMTIPEHPFWTAGRNALVVGVQPKFTEGLFLADLLV